MLGLLSLLVVMASGGRRQEILVFAAASLTDVLEQVGEEFTEETGVKVAFHFGGSNALARQILRGGPADLFVSAGSQPMDVVEDRGFLREGTRLDLLSNELVLVGLSKGSEEFESLEGLADGGFRVAVADPELAPAGYYASEALKNLELWDRLLPRLVFAADARTALSYVKSGNVDAGIVYGTDALATQGIRITASLPLESYPTITYPVGVIRTSSFVADAERFLKFLQTEKTRALFEHHGFGVVIPQKTPSR